MAGAESDNELIEQLKELIKKLNSPKKDISAWLGLAISFLSTVVIAGLSLYFSNLESERSYTYNLRQIEVQKANLKVEELKALNSLIPALSSKDTAVKNIAMQLLKATQTTPPQQNAPTNGAGNKTNIADKSPVLAESNEGETTVINEFYRLVSVVESHDQPVEARTAALVKIGKVALSPKTSASVREKAVMVTTSIATSATEPESIKSTANAILKNIKNVSASQLKDIINRETVTRAIDGIIIHHTGDPLSIAKYNGLAGILSIANFQINEFKWNKVSWHYLIAPDGSVWLGAPLNEQAIHTQNHNKTTVSVLLYMDGDKELPTDAQRSTLKQIVSLLSIKLKLGNDAVHTHHYFTNLKTCPGKLVTEEYIHKQISAPATLDLKN
jgi:hypothetical protein